jgi:hypothetical protein
VPSQYRILLDKLEIRRLLFIKNWFVGALAFGGIALALAIAGVYAVMSYAVGQRCDYARCMLSPGAARSEARSGGKMV